METSKLLDPNLDYYVIPNSFGHTSNIEDQEHNIVGQIKRKGFTIKHLLLLDSTGSQICKLDEKIWRYRTTYEIKDSEGKIFGTVKKKTYKFSSGRIMEKPNGDIILSNRKSYDEKCTEVEGANGKTIAKFCFDDEKKGFVEKYISGTIPNRLFIKISDSSFDRKTLLGFFVCLYAEMADEIDAQSSAC